MFIALADSLEKNEDLRKAWLSKDRAGLLTHTQAIFKDIKSRYNVTHFYFIGVDKVCFLRVHNPERYGDSIDRHTLKKAVQTGEIASGIELGTFGTFALRMVYPWHINGKLVGYVELGKEISHIPPKLKETLGADLLFAINKDHLDKEKWKEGLAMMGRTWDWDHFDDHVMIDTTLNEIHPDSFNPITASREGLHSFDILISDLEYAGGLLPLIDAGDNQLGNIMILIDVTKKNAERKKLITMLLAIGSIIGVLLPGFYYILLNIIERQLLQAEREKDRSHNAQTILHELLSISVRDISMTAILQQAIELLTSLSWPTLEPKGGIFLVEDDPDILVLKANIGLPKKCVRVPFGRCLCGRAAASGQVVHVNHIDECHENTYEGIAAHGHYCIPILSPSKTVWGVIVLYIPHGHVYDEKEKEFLISAANVMSGIIELKKMDEAIKNAAYHWSKTFDSITDLIFIQDYESRIIRANIAFANVFKMKPQEIVGKFSYELVQHSDSPWPTYPFQKLKKDKKPHTEEVNDSFIGIPLLITVSPVFDDKGEVVSAIHIAKDISKQKETLLEALKSQEQIKKQNIELQRLSQVKSEFISTVSHELRTPLTSIKEGISQILEGILGETTEGQKEFLSISLDEVNRLARIINDLLDISRIESKKVDMHKELLDIVLLTKGAAASLESMAEKKGLKISTDFPKASIEIYADKDRIIQVFINLINNSIKFTQTGHINISVTEKQSVIECFVSDTGSGIPKENMANIFEKFKQIDRVDGPGEKGTGLGLAIVKGIVELHKGEIHADSELNKGTKITFTLPKYTSREFFNEYLDNNLQKAIQDSQPLSVISFEIYNAESLEFIYNLVSLTKANLYRKADIAIGDSYVILAALPETNKVDARIVSERVGKVLDDYLSREELDNKIKITERIASFPEDGTTIDKLLNKIKIP
jgi:PAS domain S-box-containing protein